MDGLFLLIIMMLLALVVGSLLGCVAFFRIGSLRIRIEDLERQLDRLRAASKRKTPQTEAPAAAQGTEIRIKERVVSKPEPAPLQQKPSPPPHRKEKEADDLHSPEPSPSFTSDFIRGIRNNWMIWLGGVCVGLAGIFLVRYSIETGLLGPAQRITGATAAGLGLHALAEYLYRRTKTPHPSFAALAGGASITLYAAMLAALHLYQLVNPGFAFGVMALVSVATMLLALRYGPVLAILGILGAYVVPVLVSSDSNTILGALLYSSIITTAAALLLRYVYRPWLWYGIFAGSLGWWVISLGTSHGDGFRGVYLAVLAYIFLAVPALDWLLIRTETEDDLPVRDKTASLGWRLHPTQIGLLLVILAQTFSIFRESFSNSALFSWSPLIVILVWTCARRPSLSYLPWLSLVLQWFAWLLCGFDLSLWPIQLKGLGMELQRNFLIYAAGMTAIYSLLTWWVSRSRPFSHLRSSIIWLSPVVWLAISYLLVTDLSVRWEWAASTLVLSLALHTCSNFKLLKNPEDRDSGWLILSSHFAFSLAAAMCFRQAGLTLALATQVVSVVLMMNRYRIAGLKWMIKLILAIIATRLTLNPWLLTYPADVHWSLWTYGGSFLCCSVAAWITDPGTSMRKWLEAASLHFLVLFLAAETRYQLYNGTIFLKDYTLLEATINTLLWSSLGFVYHYREKASDYLQNYYRICSLVLMGMATVNYGIVLTVLNPLWGYEAVGTTPIWNILLPAYGMPVIIAVLCLKFFDSRFSRYAAITAGLTLFVFTCLEIRHLWQKDLDISLPTSDGELYTYSIIWLLMATGSILAAAGFRIQGLHKAGMGLLLLVVAKIFLVDMSDLEGLLRVASFMGLGLSLLGIAFLYQKMSRDDDDMKNDDMKNDDLKPPVNGHA